MTPAQSNAPVLIMAGGTGGHVFPALAVAEVLRRRGVEVVWLGTRRGLESKVVPAAGIPLERIAVSGLRGTGLRRLLTAPFMLLKACWQALTVLRRVRPQVVLGMGGFVTGPGGLMARASGRPLCIHEQNAVAGFTNRILARIASCACEAFPHTLPIARTRVTGNPVRAAISQLAPPAQRLADRQGPVRLLVFGGSQGALRLAQTVCDALAAIPEAQRPQVRLQTGERHLEAVRAHCAALGVQPSLEAFIDDMAAAYAWADLVLCRAGALTVAELTAAGLGAVLVPYPYAVDDHQTRNGRFLSEREAAVLMPESRLSVERLRTVLMELQDDRPRLLRMAEAARALARGDAADRVADACLATARSGGCP